MVANSEIVPKPNMHYGESEMTLRGDFLAEIKSAVGQCYDLGYAPTRFEQMIEKSHPVEVAKRFVISGELQYGFKELNRMGKPELTVESIMLQQKYSSLFTAEERKAAKWRLDDWDSERAKASS